MRDTNSRSEHSRELRKQTAAARRQRILDNGGLDFRALLEAEHVAKLEAIIKNRSMGQEGRANKTSVLRALIDEEVKRLSLAERVKLDQIDAFPGRSKPPTAINRAAPRYALNGDTWTGRGRKPVWVLDYLEAGGQLPDIEIKPANQPR